MLVKKSHYKNGLASQMVFYYLANVLLLLYQFLSLFRVVPSLAARELTTYHPQFQNKTITLTKERFHHGNENTLNIYRTEFIQSIYWIRPMEGCFFLLRTNETGENFNLNAQINK